MEESSSLSSAFPRRSRAQDRRMDEMVLDCDSYRGSHIILCHVTMERRSAVITRESHPLSSVGAAIPTHISQSSHPYIIPFLILLFRASMCVSK